MTALPTFARVFQWLKEAGQSLAGWIVGGATTARLWHFDRGLFCRQLASMLSSSIPLPQALAYLADEFRPSIARHINSVRQRVTEGEPLSVALGQIPSAWIPVPWRAAVAAGERTGRLPAILEMLASEIETVEEAGHQARDLLVYPVVVLALAGGIVHIVLWKVIPVYTALFAAVRTPLPLGTRALIRAGNLLSGPILMVLGLVVLYLLLLVFAPRLRLPLRRQLLSSLLHLPVVRQLWLSVVELRFARSLRVMVDAGVPLPEALNRCEEVVGDTRAGRQLAEAARRIREGEPPSRALAGVGAVTPAFVWFMAGTEQRGDFLDITAAMAEAAHEKLQTRIQIAVRVLEPLSILVLGLVIGFIVVNIYWPMFKLSTLVG